MPKTSCAGSVTEIEFDTTVQLFSSFTVTVYGEPDAFTVNVFDNWYAPPLRLYCNVPVPPLAFTVRADVPPLQAIAPADMPAVIAVGTLTSTDAQPELPQLFVQRAK